MTKNLLYLGICIMMLPFVSPLSAQAQGEFELKVVSTYATGIFDEGAVEIVGYDEVSERAFFVNADANVVTVLDLSNPENPELVTEISHEEYGAGVNSLAVKNGIIAVAVEAEETGQAGKVVFWTTHGTYLNDVEAGFLPDMVTFTPDGNYVLVANEGEPNDDYTIDPEGSISVIDLSGGVAKATVATADFSAFTNADSLRNLGIRIFGPNATPAQDLEPEYIAVSDDNTTAYVACQENNALAIVDIASATVTQLVPLGTKDHSLIGNEMDASNEDGGINFRNHPVMGFYMPDAITYVTINGNGYILSANEGDARDYDGYSEEARVKDLVLDSASYPNADSLQMDENLGRLNTTLANGDFDGDGDVDQIFSYGARSFSIWDAATGTLVWDSGSELEKITAQYYPFHFNATNDENNFDNRSDDKGPEPEAVEVAHINGETYALVGLERIGGIVVYNISDPNDPQFITYVNNRNFFTDAESEDIGDLGIEDIVFVPAESSPNGVALVLTGNEVSGTFTVFSVNQQFNVDIFDEEINITDFAPEQVIIPPSPLKQQILFVGGHDIVQTTETYGNPAGQAIAKEWHDFIGWTPDNTGESMGWVTVNHEMVYRDDRIGDGGGMTAFRVDRNADGTIEILDQTLEDGRNGKFFNVDFANTVGETGMNCGGITAPDGRIWTAEEWYREGTSDIYEGGFSSPGNGDLPMNPAPMSEGYGVRDTSEFTINAPEFPLVDGMTIPKYENFNYMVEIDPKQAKAIRKQYNWGRAGWEGGAISQDMKTVYLGIDGVPSPFVKYEAASAGDFTDGTLYVFKHDNAVGEKWIQVPETIENVFGGLDEFAWSVGATLFMRNEWVTIDPKTGIVYFSETGRDSRSSGAGIVFNAASSQTNAVVAPHHEALARQRGHKGATDVEYQDYYGRVMYYNPETEEIGVAVEGGPYFETSPTEVDYPDKHLSNPDGLNMIEIGGQSFLMICEDLNGRTFGRVPEGISNSLCELYIVDTRNIPASVDDLIRITAVPAGAEITGAVQIDESTILVNSQHPNSNNPFPYNHSLTMAIYGFDDVKLDCLGPPNEDELVQRGMTVNEVTRELSFSKKSDFAIYDNHGKRLSVHRNTKTISIDGMNTGKYYIQNADKDLFELILQ